MQTKLKSIMSSKKGFTLIELLVVIGILAVLAAIAIPSVAGLIDRANVSADATNANEMTNALERFTSEYELFVQDIGSGALNVNDLDSAQGRVYNVVGVDDRAGITGIELATGYDSTAVRVNASAASTTNVSQVKDHAWIYRDTKYAANANTMVEICENYMKTSSATFSPKQSDCHFYYSPQCGLVVCLETDKVATKGTATAYDSSVKGDDALDALVVSGMDAKGKKLAKDGTSNAGEVDVEWIDLTYYVETLEANGTLVAADLIY